MKYILPIILIFVLACSSDSKEERVVKSSDILEIDGIIYLNTNIETPFTGKTEHWVNSAIPKPYLIQINTYKDGKLHGDVFHFDDNGHCTWKQTYIDGKEVPFSQINY